MSSNGRPVVVVGAGVAGLATALAAAPAPITLISRDVGAVDCASTLAQGGLAAAVGPGDTPASHAADTLAAGARYNSHAMVTWLTRQAPDTLDWLQQHGVVFDRDTSGRLALALEGGHSHARVAHAGGDASGAALVAALRRAVTAAGHVRWQQGLDVAAIGLQDGRVRGVRALDATGRRHDLPARAVVLATGGIGALFARTSNPPGSNGAGLALGLAAGAAARDLEFVQFHPTALNVPGQHLPLVTEALRGAGARLIDDEGKPLMAGRHPLGDLAPRDVVARRVWQGEHQGGAWLDATGGHIDLDHHFPTVLAACLAHGIDARREPIPVTPAVHFHMGGLAVDAEGATAVPGLFAVGEVACNRVHGANRLASNSLLEGISCGRRLGQYLCQHATPAAGVDALHWISCGESLAADETTLVTETLWQAAGPVRSGPAMRAALQRLEPLASRGWQAALAHRLLQAALTRPQSLGAHFRSDATTEREPPKPHASTV